MNFILSLVITVLYPSFVQAGDFTVTPEGNLAFGEESFFPFGIYHVSWVEDPTSEHNLPRRGISRDNDLERIHAAGFDSIVASLDPTSPVIQAPQDYRATFDFLNLAKQREMHVIAEIYLPSAELLVDAMKQVEPILAWQVGDDFNVTTSVNHASPKELGERSRRVKGADPEGLTYASGGSAIVSNYLDFSLYKRTVDIIGVQSYPAGNTTDFPKRFALERHFKNMEKRCDEIQRASAVPIANLQSFSWDSENPVFPTPEEVRNQLYATLICGYKGIIYYTFYHGQTANGEVTADLQSPRVWEELKKLSSDVGEISPFLLEAERSRLPFSAKGLFGARWETTDETLLIVMSTNTLRETSFELDFSESAIFSGQIEPAFADGRYDSNLSLEQGKLSGSLGPAAVAVVKLRHAVEP